MMQLDHPNILKVLDFRLSGEYTSINGSQKRIPYVVTEYIPNAELLSYANISPFPDELSRYYIK